MSVIAELKRRNVFRVAALYLVAAWVLLQVGDLLFGLLGLPTSTNKLLFAGLVLGFVPALIFSWVYELTPEGLKREHEVERNASITAETARKLDLIVVGLLVVAIGMLGVNWYMDRRAATGERPAASAVATAPTAATGAPVSSASQLAVLPFELAHADEASGYLGLAIPDAITTRLANVRALRIRPTVTVLRVAQRETDPQRIGQALGVDHVLTGILYTGDSHVQVNLQLVRVGDGVPVWGENVRVPADELGRLQDHPFVESIIKALRVQITAIERERLLNPQPVDSAAYRLYLAGRADLALHTEAAMRNAVQRFQAAIDRDARFAAAYAGLATAAAEMALRFASRHETEQWRERAMAAAQEAVRLDPHAADAHEAMTAIYRKTEFKWDLVLEHGLRALELNPNLQQPYFYIAGAYYHLGLFDEALAAVDRGIEVNPVGDLVEGQRARGVALLLDGRFADARAALEEVQPLSDPRTIDHYLASAIYYLGDVNEALDILNELSASSSASASSRARATLAAVLGQLGKRDEAEKLALEVGGGAVPGVPGANARTTYLDHHVAYGLATAWAQLGHADRALAWLENAAETGFPCYPWFERDKLLDPVRKDPAVQSFLDSMRAAYAKVMHDAPKLARKS